jgi:hypothetical protein
MDEKITITRPQLKAALLAWEQDSRDGKTMDPAVCASMPTEEVAELSTAALLDELRGR